ncbi:MAG: S8 family serine peptidase [Hyphomicrobium sp.]
MAAPSAPTGLTLKSRHLAAGRESWLRISLYILCLTILQGASPVQAGDRDRDRDRDRQRSEQQAKEAQESAKKAQERAKEQAREAAKAQQEQAEKQKKAEQKQNQQNQQNQKSEGKSNKKSDEKKFDEKPAVAEPYKGDDQPARTVQEMFERSTAPPATKPDKSNAQSPDVPTPSRAQTPDVVTKPTTSANPNSNKNDGNRAPVKPAVVPDKKDPSVKTTERKTEPAKPTKKGGGAPSEYYPDFEPRELLAVNANRKMIARALGLGYTLAESTPLNALGLTVARLIPPRGVSAAAAAAKLRAVMPNKMFETNKSYRIYRTATGTDGAQEPSKSVTRHGITRPCQGDHCTGRQLVGWRPDLAACSRGVRVGIIDTAVDVAHPAFRNKTIEVSHFSKEAKSEPDWHGTGITSMLAGDASSGTPGLIPDAAFLVADVFHSGSDNQPASDTMTMLRALDWLESRQVGVINMSLSGPPDEVIRTALRRLTAKGVIVVAAAGNEGPGAEPSYPAAYKGVIAVTAVGKNLAVYRHANRGPYIAFAAPGVDIWTALPGAREGYHSGTSFAAPFVTAAIAAIYPRLARKSPNDALRMIKVKDLGTPGIDPVYGRGLVLAPEPCQPATVATTTSASAAAETWSAETVPSAPSSDASADPLPWLTLAPTP